MRLFVLISVASVLAAPAFAAETVVSVGKFESVELRGGGTVVIHQGPVQRVTVRSSDPERPVFDVSDHDGRGGRLVIRACEGSCSSPHDFEVDIETPNLSGASVMGGGGITAEGPFRAQAAVSAAVHGGGKVDLRALNVSATSAEVMGGGRVFVSAKNSLSATVNGGGAIRYSGSPTVDSAIHGGGSIDPIR